MNDIKDIAKSVIDIEISSVIKTDSKKSQLIVNSFTDPKEIKLNIIPVESEK